MNFPIRSYSCIDEPIKIYLHLMKVGDNIFHTCDESESAGGRTYRFDEHLHTVGPFSHSEFTSFGWGLSGRPSSSLLLFLRAKGDPIEDVPAPHR